MSDLVTISFVGNVQIKELLREWAAADDRSISYVLRQILIQEARRRNHQVPKQVTPSN